MEGINLILYNLTPELLDRDALIKILRDRCIDLPNMNAMSKDVLVELFHRVVAPLPQRTRGSGQLQQMPLAQESRGFSIGFSGATSSSSLQPNSRLKPPPDVSSTHRKVKLSTATSQGTSHLDKIVIHDRRKMAAQNEIDKSTDGARFCVKDDVLDKIVINNRTKERVIPEDTQTCAINKTEQLPKSSNNPAEDETGSVGQSVNLSKPRLKLKRPSVGSGVECTTQASEPEVKKPKTRIVF